MFVWRCITFSQAERNRQRAENPADHIGEFYDHHSYRNAVKYAIEKANREGQNIPHWTPYQLRHAGITEVEKTEGLEAARALAGHTTVNMTKHYAHGRQAITEELARNRRSPFDTAGENAGTIEDSTDQTAERRIA